jgi:predicted KAP-like P-loop ATPase
MGTTMSSDLNYSDNPIQSTENDLFAISGFAKSLANGILKMERPEGMVVAINGPWGSGKSSVINLIKQHLQPNVNADKLSIVTFNPWWFKGEDALTLGFFSALQQAMKPSLSKKSKKSLPKIGASLLRLASSIAPAADAAGAMGGGAAAGATLGWISSLIDSGDSIESLFEDLFEGLNNSKKRFVIVLDDIDRLAPDEALTVFRLIKSVGRLPNTTYVLAFDRILSEKMVSERFPSEGANFLEKIIQVSFDIPLPSTQSLNAYLSNHLGKILDEVEDDVGTHIGNMFHDIVSPEIRTPRDASRYLNALSLTWPCVAGEVDVGDFIALEAYRLFQPGIYRAIRDNQSLLCGAASSGLYGEKQDGEKIEVMLLNSVDDKERYRQGLIRLFPKLESIWSNTYHSGSFWAKQRRVCVSEFFPLYFRLSLPDDVVPMSEIKEFISKSNDSIFIADYFKTASKSLVQAGGSRAALLLNALNTHAKDIPLENTTAFLSGLFSVADEINLAIDDGGASTMTSNSLRLHWLLRSLLWERTTLEQRSEIIRTAAEQASLHWAVDLAMSAWEDYNPGEGKDKEQEDKCLCSEEDSKYLFGKALASIRAASRDGMLIQNRKLGYLLYRWRNLTNDDGVEVKKWIADSITDSEKLCLIAEALISNSWSHGMSDRVSKKSEVVHVKSLDSIMNKEEFFTHVAKLKSNATIGTREYQVADRFLEAWEYSLNSRW